MRNPKHTLVFAILTFASMGAGQDKTPAAATTPDIPADLTISQLNSVVEAQALTIQRLQARVTELEATPKLLGQIGGNISKMQAVCQAKKSTLAVNPQTGLYQPNKDGLPYCVPDPPPIKTPPAVEPKPPVAPAKEVKPKNGN
jgi:hypothetical protein